MACNITEVVLDPQQRIEHINRLLRIEGLTPDKIKEYIETYKQRLAKQTSDHAKMTAFLDQIRKNLDDTGFIEADKCCYSGLALTGVSKEEMPRLKEDHFTLKEAIVAAGLSNYDPVEAPFNPQNKHVGKPTRVSDVDILMVVASRYFTFTNLAPSTGGGMEQRTANLYNKMPIVVVKRGMQPHPSRMSTGARRVMVLEYDNIQQQRNEITDYISMLRSFNPGIGTCSEHGNTLVGFQTGKTYCLPGLMLDKFPNFRYDDSKFGK